MRLVPRTGWKDPLPQCDYGGVVDVVPLHVRTGIQPEHPAIQTAPEMHDGALLVNGQELARPDVVLGGAHGDQRRPPGGDANLAEVVIEAADRFLRVPVAQDRAVEIGVQRLEIQGRQHGLRGAAEIDGNLLGHASEASIWWPVWFGVCRPAVTHLPPRSTTDAERCRLSHAARSGDGPH